MFEQHVANLTYDDAAVRYEAARKLGASADARAIEHLIAALPDENSKVQYAAFSGLIKLNAYEAAEPILTMLANDLDSRVWELLKLNIGMRLRSGLLDLMQPSDGATAEKIMHVLDTHNLDEQQRALFVRLLGRVGDAERVELLIDLLIHGTAPVQGAAAEALGYVGDVRGIAPLLLLLSDQSDELRETGAEALGRIGDASAFEPLLALIGDESEWVRRAVVVALGNLGDLRAIEPLSEALNDESKTVQDAAFEALQRLNRAGDDVTL